MKILRVLGCICVVWTVSTSQAADSFIDGVDAPMVYHPLVIGNFDDGTTQGWGKVRIDAIGAVGGVLTNTNVGGLGSDGSADSYLRYNTAGASVLPGVPENFLVGELPGQYDIVQFDLRFDTLPPEDPGQPGTGLINPALRGRQFLQGGATDGVNFFNNSHLQSLVDNSDNGFHTYTILRDFNDSAWNVAENIVRIDVLDNLNNNTGNSDSVLGTKFSVDNVILGRTTATEAFPAINVARTNLVRNGDLAATSNLVLGGTNTGAANINGGNGNFGPFRGNTVDVDDWTPYNNNPNSIVEAVNGADGTGLNLLNSAGTNQGSYYLDTHWSASEKFSLNSAGGYLNGLMQSDILDGVTIDETATYELSFDTVFNENRASNPDSNFKVGLTVGTGLDATDPSTAVAGSLFDQQLNGFNSGDVQTLSISGAALKAAQDSGEPVNLIVQSLANTSIVNFPGTPVPDNHVDGAVFTQVQVDNLSLVKTFAVATGDLNRDGLLSQADVALANLYLNGNGGETAAKRQDDLAAAPSAPFAVDVLNSLNLGDFDLNGDDYFDAADITVLEGLVPAAGLACDFTGDLSCDAADIDLLYANFGGSLAFDVDGDMVVDAGDISAWLAAASDPANIYLGGTKTFVLGDVDLDGDVDSGDLGTLLNNFGDTNGLLHGAGNLNGDANIDSGDLGFLLNSFGATSAAAAAVPEPSSFTLSLLLLLGLGAVGRRNRRQV